MLFTTTSRVALCTAIASGLLLVAGCSAGEGSPSERFQELIAEAVHTHDRDVPSLGLSNELQDPVRHTCAPTIDAPGDWHTRAPGRTVEEGPVELGVHGTPESGTTELVVTVVAPNGTRSAIEADFVADEWSRTVYPDDFTDADLVSGVHSVIWSDGGNGNLLACAGFEVERR